MYLLLICRRMRLSIDAAPFSLISSAALRFLYSANISQINRIIITNIIVISMPALE
jgi:hypothetical protein